MARDLLLTGCTSGDAFNYSMRTELQLNAEMGILLQTEINWDKSMEVITSNVSCGMQLLINTQA